MGKGFIISSQTDTNSSTSCSFFRSSKKISKRNGVLPSIANGKKPPLSVLFKI